MFCEDSHGEPPARRRLFVSITVVIVCVVQTLIDAPGMTYVLGGRIMTHKERFFLARVGAGRDTESFVCPGTAVSEVIP